jgi:hypothetical protein
MGVQESSDLLHRVVQEPLLTINDSLEISENAGVTRHRASHTQAAPRQSAREVTYEALQPFRCCGPPSPDLWQSQHSV